MCLGTAPHVMLRFLTYTQLNEILSLKLEDCLRLVEQQKLVKLTVLQQPDEKVEQVSWEQQLLKLRCQVSATPALQPAQRLVVSLP